MSHTDIQLHAWARAKRYVRHRYSVPLFQPQQQLQSYQEHCVPVSTRSWLFCVLLHNDFVQQGPLRIVILFS